MNKLIDSLNFNITRRVPNSGFTTTYFNTPILNPKSNVKIIGSGALYKDNNYGFSIKDTTSSISLSLNNITSTLSPTGILVSNKLPDPNFSQGGTYWTYTPVGYWSVLTSGYRTSTNSKYNTGDDPTGTTCAKAQYNTTDPTQAYTLYTTLVSAISSGEAGVAWGNIGYQLSFWLASDPVNSNNSRINESGTFVNSANTNLSINVEFYNSASTLISSSIVDTISYQDLDFKPFLIQSSKKYFRYMSKIFNLPTSGSTYISIKLVGYGIQGLWFSDFKLSSYIYSQINSIFNSKQGISTTQSSISSLANTGTNLLSNSNLSTPIGLNYNSPTLNSDYGNIQDIYYLNNLGYPSIVYDGSVEYGGWTPGTVSPATLNPVIGNPNMSSTYLAYGGSDRVSDVYKKSSSWLMLFQQGQTFSWYSPLDTGLSSGLLTLSTYEQASQGGANSSVKSYLKVVLLDVNLSTLNTIQSSIFTSSATWTNRTLTFSVSAYPTAAYVYVSVICTGATSTVAHIWDDISVYLNTNPVTGWTITPSNITTGSYAIEYKNYNGHSGLFMKYLNTGTNRTSHVFYSDKPIYKNVTTNSDINFLNYYLATEDKLQSNNFIVNTNVPYSFSFGTYWTPPGSSPNRTDNDSTLTGCFTQPFTQTNQTNGTITNFNNYGYITVVVNGINSTGGVSETPYTTTYSPQNGNLPVDYLWDPTNLLNFTNLLSSKFSFTNSTTVSGQTIFKLSACNLGVGNFVFTPYGSTAVSNTTVYTDSKLCKITNPIEVDKIKVDPSGGWRACIKDGLFERDYILSSADPSGSWLRSVGFVNGDEITLIYTVPEYNLSSYWDPINHTKEAYRLPGIVLDDHTLLLTEKNVVAIKELYINGTNLLSGFTYLDALQTNYPTLISGVNANNGTISFIKTLTETDDIEVTFYYKEDRYTYFGYFDGATYHDLDLNPGAGHKYSQDISSNGLYTKDLINSVVTIYLIPVAAYLTSQTGLGTYTYKTAFDVSSASRPSCFVRHTVSSNNVEAQSIIDPSATIIGKIFVTPPGSIEDVDIVDIRTRGGGLSEEIDPNNLPLYFNQEFKVSVNTSWNSYGINLQVGDILEVYGLGYTKDISNNLTINSSGTLFGAVNSTTPSTTGFLANTYIQRICNYTYISSSSSWTNTENQCPSGFLYLKLINTNLPTSGSLYSKIRIKRKVTRKSIWDSGSWDGDPILMNGVVIFEIPEDVLTGSNGYTKFTSQQVQDIVNKNAPAGVLPIILYK